MGGSVPPARKRRNALVPDENSLCNNSVPRRPRPVRPGSATAARAQARANTSREPIKAVPSLSTTPAAKKFRQRSRFGPPETKESSSPAVVSSKRTFTCGEGAAEDQVAVAQVPSRHPPTLAMTPDTPKRQLPQEMVLPTSPVLPAVAEACQQAQEQGLYPQLCKTHSAPATKLDRHAQSPSSQDAQLAEEFTDQSNEQFMDACVDAPVTAGSTSLRVLVTSHNIHCPSK